MTRVLVVDDHELFRAGVRSGSRTWSSLGDAATVEEAVRQIEEKQPEVVLLDVHMPDGGGVEVIRRAEADTRFLALSVSDAAEDVIAVIRAGARGYVTKTISGPELADAIERVKDGDAVFSPGSPASCSTPSPARPPRPVIPSSTSSRRGTRGGPAPGARLHVQGDRSPPRHLHQDRGGPRPAVLRKLQLSSRHEISRWAAERRLL